MSTTTTTIAELPSLKGQELGTSDWIEITQDRVNTFADATGDHQWIHIDVERAKAESPFGGPIAHGYLTLSLMVPLVSQTYSISDSKMGVNYGLNKVRFPAPVPVGSKVRARETLNGVGVGATARARVTQRVGGEAAGGLHTALPSTIEREGGKKPVCIAEWVTRA